MPHRRYQLDGFPVPSPHQAQTKPAASAMAPKESVSSARQQRRSSLFSCFKGSSVLDSDDTESPVSMPSSGRKALWFSPSKLRAKNKTVPVGASSSEIGVGAFVGSDQKSSAKKARNDTVSKGLDKLRHRKNQQQGEAPNEAPARAEAHQPCHIAAQYNTRAPPTPLLCVRDQARTGTSTVHPGLQEASHPARAPSRKSWKRCAETAGRLEPGAGMSVLAMTLVMMTLFGRACAVVCVCAWFYLLPRLRPAVVHTVAKKGACIDVDSEAYKNRVVLEGLLERKNKRGPVAGSVRASIK